MSIYAMWYHTHAHTGPIPSKCGKESFQVYRRDDLCLRSLVDVLVNCIHHISHIVYVVRSIRNGKRQPLQKCSDKIKLLHTIYETRCTDEYEYLHGKRDISSSACSLNQGTPTTTTKTVTTITNRVAAIHASRRAQPSYFDLFLHCHVNRD